MAQIYLTEGPVKPWTWQLDKPSHCSPIYGVRTMVVGRTKSEPLKLKGSKSEVISSSLGHQRLSPPRKT